MASIEGQDLIQSTSEDATSLAEPDTSLAARFVGMSNRAIKRRKYQIKRLEKKLEMYQTKIVEAMNEEVSLEEMDSDTSAYLKEDFLKRKFMNTWYELCRLLGISPDIQLTSELHNQTYNSTPYPQINHRVERLLKSDEFPDYWDVVQLIEHSNKKYSLGMDEKEILQMSRVVFQEIGEKIKVLRRQGWEVLFNSYMNEEVTDPASSEPDLEEVLKKNREQGHKRLNDVYDEFATRQENEGDQSASPTDEEGEDEEEESASKRRKSDSDTPLEDIEETDPVGVISGGNMTDVDDGGPVADIPYADQTSSLPLSQYQSSDLPDTTNGTIIEPISNTHDDADTQPPPPSLSNNEAVIAADGNGDHFGVDSQPNDETITGHISSGNDDYHDGNNDDCVDYDVVILENSADDSQVIVLSD
jgi:hypothetical protein